MASAECPICGKAIGYEVDFYLDNKNAGKPTHALCLEAKIEKEREVECFLVRYLE